AQEKGFTCCAPSETTLGQIGLQSTDPAYSGALLKIALEQSTSRAMTIDVKAGPDVVIGAPPMTFMEFSASPESASAKILDRIERARLHQTENGSLIKRLTSFFGPR
ncbi:MAG: hypothetical protein HYU57_04925, partial [Micavibrio aeruginosavorus]|nr:hypothetical protein [Micavibrio aeruginosavorus]